MLRRQEELRFAPETLERMRSCTASSGEWLDVVRDLQREVAIETLLWLDAGSVSKWTPPNQGNYIRRAI